MYFIPLLAEALSQPDPEQGLPDAFKAIVAMGQQPRYQQGFDQFRLFIEEVVRSAQAQEAIELAARDHLAGHPAAPRTDLLSGLTPQPNLQLVLTKGETHVSTVNPEKGPRTARIRDIQPGHYLLHLSTGRVIWEANLGRTQLLWTDAYPGQPLAMAAHTEGVEVPPMIHAVLLGGEVVVRVFAGLESGLIEVSVGESQ